MRNTPEEGKRFTIALLTRHAGCCAPAAREMNIDRATLWMLLNRHGLWDELQAIRAKVEKLYGVKTHRRGFATTGLAL